MVTVLLIAAILMVGRITMYLKFRKMVRELLSLSGSISGQRFNYMQLAGLPEPVMRYFNHVIPDGQTYISYARIKHKGQFKAGFDKDWMNIAGEQYATTQRPGFIWKGTTALCTARDMYVADKGRLIVSVLWFINVVNGRGKHYDQGELLRWLAESVLYPTNLLPSERLAWLPVNRDSARIIFKYSGLELGLTVRFNETGEIIEMEAERYMDESNLETWIIQVSDYKLFAGILIPSYFEVNWRLKKGTFCYAKFNITQVEYDKNELF